MAMTKTVSDLITRLKQEMDKQKGSKEITEQQSVSQLTSTKSQIR